MIEATLYDQLNTLGYYVAPLAPDADSPAPVGNVDGPVIVYRRKDTTNERTLAGDLVFSNIQMEIMTTADTSQQALSIANEIYVLLDNQIFDGIRFYHTNQFINENNLTVVHQWFSGVAV